ncbi:hypothetical protein AX14_011033, partial [Amanita brunnescens Koide BX004]
PQPEPEKHPYLVPYASESLFQTYNVKTKLAGGKPVDEPAFPSRRLVVWIDIVRRGEDEEKI